MQTATAGYMLLKKFTLMLQTLEELQVKQEEISSLGRACQETSKALRLSDTLSRRGSLLAVFSFYFGLSMVLLEG